ncbi:zinc finger and BTB domain-containing protein 49 [Patella vulgata]|uniref:zinc finger and BTB domain-containing protein 49 n=2 Tax=Patella vulgata TaxID=6465 RepID=UPI00217FA9AD|nr:zinc finger and BTB domain-containing protein 49 [Patella vulgata]
MENLSEDEALPNYSYQPQYNLHGLVDISTLQHYQGDNQSHISLHNANIHPNNDLQTSHLTDYAGQSYVGLGHTVGYGDGQMTSGYPTAISPISDQQLSLSSSLGSSWSNSGLAKAPMGRWGVEQSNPPSHRVEVGGIGWTDILHKNMHQLMEVDMMCDTIILTNTQQIKVHKLILMSSSDYLLTLLKRYDNLKMIQLRLPVTVTMEALKTFISFLYLGKADLTSENIRDIAALANIFKIQVLKDLIVKLSGNDNLVSGDKLFDVQPTVIDVCERRDQCIDTSSLVLTTEQGINTDSSFDNSTSSPPSTFLDDNGTDERPVCKKLPKKSQLVSSAAHTYGTRSTASQGTPKSRRKTYLEEQSKKDMEEAAAGDKGIEVPQARPEVYRGKKSRLLAGAPKQDTPEVQPPKTRGKFRRKIELVDNENFVAAPLNLSDVNDASATSFVPSSPDDQNASAKRGRFRKIGTGNQMTVRPPPKKRAKMELQLSEDHLCEAVDDELPITVFSVPAEAQVQTPKAKSSPKKSPSQRNKRRRNSRWGKSKNLVAIASDIENMAEHIPENERQFKCNLCGNEFVFAKRCISHMVKTHGVEETNVIPNVIIRSKDESSPKVCDICGYKTKDQNFCYIHYHKYFKHGVPLPQGWEIYKCDQCGKEYFTKFMLKDHKLTHKEDTPFICETCGQGFKTRTCLNSHVFHRHKEVRKHGCPECKKKFKTKTQMSVHYRTHTGEKPFSCPECDYKSTTRGNMRLHLTNKHKHNVDNVQLLMQKMTSGMPPADMANIVKEIKEAEALEIDIAVPVENLVQVATCTSVPIDSSVPIATTVPLANPASVATTLPVEILSMDKLTTVLRKCSGIKWMDIGEQNGQDAYTCALPQSSSGSAILLPVSQTNQPSSDGTSTYTTYTLVPSSDLLNVKSLGVDPERTTTTLKPVSLTPPPAQQSSHLYMQHSPISPAATVSPDGHFQTPHNMISSPITPPPPTSHSPYPSASNMVNSPISPPQINMSYQTYAHNLSNSPISPPAPTMSPNQSYQNINSVSPVNLQTAQSMGQDGGIVSDGDVDSSYNQQQYDTALLQVYYQQQNFYQQGY